MLRKILTMACAAALCAAPASAQNRFERSFTAGDVSRYRVQLTVRSELEGQNIVESEGKAYATPYTQTFELSLSWIATRRVVSVRPDGGADVEEALTEFSDVSFTAAAGSLEMDARELRDELRGALERWRDLETHKINYQETRMGILTGVPLREAPRLDDEPPLLTPWLLRALRPTAALPDREFRMSAQWEEPRAVEISGWRDVTGTESGQWLAGPTATATLPPSVRLHVVQQISGSVLGVKRPDGRADTIGDGRFHAESLSTLVERRTADPRMWPGKLMAATRSASREVTRVLDPVPGMSQPPRFRARISAQVEITLLPE